MRSFGMFDVEYLLRMTSETLVLTLIAFIGGAIGGIVLALCRTSPLRSLRVVSSAYIQLLQATPLLMLLFCIYFGLSIIGFNLPALVAASIGLTLYASAFLGEVWRGAIQAIPRQQWEAASSLALTLMQQRIYVVFPQAIRAAIPPTVGFLVQILKNTSVTSIIGFVELTRGAALVNNSTFEPFKVFGTVAIIYFGLCFPLALLSRRLEKRLNGSGRSKGRLKELRFNPGAEGRLAGG
jgi:polar amino acid transport system permease protein